MSLHLQVKVFGTGHQARGWPLAATLFQAGVTVIVAVVVATTSSHTSSTYFVDWLTAVRWGTLPDCVHLAVHAAMHAGLICDYCCSLMYAPCLCL